MQNLVFLLSFSYLLYFFLLYSFSPLLSILSLCWDAAGHVDMQPNRILLVTIHHMLYPITVEVLHHVFSPHGFVEKIVTFQKSAGQHLQVSILSLAFLCSLCHTISIVTLFFVLASHICSSLVEDFECSNVWLTAFVHFISLLIWLWKLSGFQALIQYQLQQNAVSARNNLQVSLSIVSHISCYRLIPWITKFYIIGA